MTPFNTWCANPTKNGKRVNVRVWFYRSVSVRLHMQQNGWLNPEFYDPVINSGFKHLIRVSRQAFPRKIGKKVRRVSETHEDRNITYACRVCGISTLGIAGTCSQLCITDYKKRNAAGKNHYFNWFAHQACTHTYLDNFCLKQAFFRPCSN